MTVSCERECGEANLSRENFISKAANLHELGSCLRQQRILVEKFTSTSAIKSSLKLALLPQAA